MSDTPLVDGCYGDPVMIERMAKSFERELGEMRKDAERWQASVRLGAPEFCGHWDGEKNGQGWYHQHLGSRWFETAEDAIDAAMKQRGGD